MVNPMDINITLEEIESVDTLCLKIKGILSVTLTWAISYRFEEMADLIEGS